jgi:hypothetical protein
MGVFDRLERKLEAAVGAAFARAFGGSVVPKEVEVALQREATDRVAALEGGYQLAPNSYTVVIGESDHERFTADEVLSARAFARHLEEFIREQGWSLYGAVNVRFERDESIHTGDFRVHSAVDPDAANSGVSAAGPRQAPAHPAPAPAASQPVAEPQPRGADLMPSYRDRSASAEPQPYYDPDFGEPVYGDEGRGPDRGAEPHSYGGYAGQDSYDAPQYGAHQYGSAPQGGGGWRRGPLTASLELRDGSGRSFTLRHDANVIGRGQDAQFRVPDTGVSRRHAEIRWDGQVALLSDLESTNGTIVNGSPVTVWQLADGDVIRIGNSEIVVHIG